VPGAVAHAYNCSYSGGRDGGTEAQGQSGQNILETPSQPMAGHSGACEPGIPATWGSTNRRIAYSLGIKKGSNLKITKAKRAGGMA
jgi:hypothetical protein